MTLAALVGAGCTDRSEPVATTGCGAAVDAAARAIELDEQKQHLDRALLQCRSAADLTAELARHPGLIGYSPATFVTVRCERIDDPATRAAPICAAAVEAEPPVTTTTQPTVVFVGDTLDDRRIELRPGPGIRFVGEVPEVVQETVDIAFASGCDGLIAQRDRWFARIDEPAMADEASVYARHAQNVAAYIGCTVPPLPDGG